MQIIYNFYMKLALTFALPMRDYYGELAQDYYARLREFFKFGKSKGAANLVFVAGKCKNSLRWTSEELAEYLKEQMISGTKGLMVSVVDAAAIVSNGEADENMEQSDGNVCLVELLNFVPSRKGTDLLAVLALEQLYRACMIIAGRTYHK